MGYRSDVRIIVSRNGYKKLKKYVDEHIKKYKINNIKEGTVAASYNYDFNLLNSLDVSKTSEDNKQIYIGWNDLKWYDGYEEVDAIMDSLSKLEDNGYGYWFTRIGENIEDIEEQYNDSTSKDGVKYLDSPSVIRCFDDSEYKDIDLSKESKRNDRDDR